MSDAAAFSLPCPFKGSTVGCGFASGEAAPALISLHLSTAFQEGTAHPNHLIASSGINHSRSTDVKKTMLICISTWPAPISLWSLDQQCFHWDLWSQRNTNPLSNVFNQCLPFFFFLSWRHCGYWPKFITTQILLIWIWGIFLNIAPCIPRL